MTRHASLLALLLLAACGPATPDPQPAPEATVTAALSAEPAPSATAVATAAPAEPAKPSPDVDGADGIRRMAAWDGPKTGAAVTTKKAWVWGANTMGNGDKLSFSSVALRLVEVVKADGNELVYKERDKQYAVPAALAWNADAAKGLKKGGVVRCNFGGNTSVARVDAVDAKGVTCAFRFMEKSRKEKLKLDEVRALSGKLEPGAPAIVGFDGDSSRYRGVVVAVSGDDVWVTVDTQFGNGDAREGRAVHKVKAANVTVIDASKPLKAGDACLASRVASIDTCKVDKVIDGGLAYAVTFESGGGLGKEWQLDEVAAAPKKK